MRILLSLFFLLLPGRHHNFPPCSVPTLVLLPPPPLPAHLLPPHFDGFVARARQQQAHGDIHCFQVHDGARVTGGGRYRAAHLSQRDLAWRGYHQGRKGAIPTHKQFPRRFPPGRVRARDGGGQVFRGRLTRDQARDSDAVGGGGEVPGTDVMVRGT